MTDIRPSSEPIDIAICTYRRESIAATLQSLAAQMLPAGVRLRVIVADNDTTDRARSAIEARAAALALDCTYVHAPERNIAVARNACLTAARAPLLAFIDDDEVASPRWLAALTACMAETGADAVLGPAIAIYPREAPNWLHRADLHSTRPPLTAGGVIRTGYTCNVLLRRAAFAGMRFDPALGRSGGEDDVFFATAVRGGARIAYAPSAIVDDPVPLARARLGWLARRAFRNGQTHARIRIADDAPRDRTLALAAGKAAVCMAGAIVAIPTSVRSRRLFVRGMLHVGACAGYLGWRELQLY